MSCSDNFKAVKPSPSYTLRLPEDVCLRVDGQVTSFYRKGESLLLQLSSYIRNEGKQVGATERLKERMSKHGGKRRLRKSNIHAPEESLDQAAVEFVDESGVLWIYAYLVWPHVTVYATLSASESEISQAEWAMDALGSIRLAIQ